MKDRGEKLPIEDLHRISTEIKEKHGYVCRNGLLDEFKLYDKNKKKFKSINY